MNIAALHKTMTALPLIAMLALAGCGGGGGGSTSMAPGGPMTPEPPTEQQLIERAIERAETALATAMSAAEDAADDCAFLSSACTDASTAAAAVTTAETALDDAREATTSALAETAATAAETAATEATTALTATQLAVSAPVGPAPAAGQVTDGLATSAATKLVATDSTEIGTLFSTQPNTTYSPISGGLRRDFTTDTASLESDLLVHSVQRTSAGGYLVVYTDGHTQYSVEFLPEHCQSGYCRVPNGNANDGLWAWTSAGPDYRVMGPPLYSYLHALQLVANPAGDEESRIAFVFGVTTPPATLQTLGEASYQGFFRADAYRTGDPNRNVRQRYSGRVLLVANFDISRLYGRIVDVRGSEPGSSARARFPTSSFRISEGEIHSNGQFTATLTGLDSDDTVLDEDSVRDFMGQILGEFYGPNGEELGGTVTASRDLPGDANDRVFQGYIRGQKGRDIAIDNSAQLSSLVNRNYPNSQTSIGTSASAMVETTTDGYRVTFTIDGVEKAVDVTDADLGGITGNTYNFQKVVDTASVSRRFYLWRFSGDFPGQPQYDYLDVNGVILSDYTPGGSQDDVANLNDVTSGYVVRGTRTSTNDMPTGSASYSGEMHAREWPTDTLSSYSDADVYRGNFSMAADFAAGTVTGTVSDVDVSPRLFGTYTSSPSTGLTFQGAVSGNEITASALAGTGAFAGYSGTAEGAFYGPAAAEVGGVFEGSATDKLLQGYFAGDKQ